MITPPSTDYLSVLRDAHQSNVRVTLYRETETVPELVGELPVIRVAVTYDGKANVHRSADIEYGVDPWTTVSRETIEQVSTEGGLITIEHGVAPAGAETIAWALIATLRVDSNTSDAALASRLLYAYDRAILVQEHLLETARPLNDTYVNLIETMLQETLPNETLTIGPGFTPGELALMPTAGKSLGAGASRLAEMQLLADVIGGTVGNDPDGSFTLRKVVPGGETVWTIDSGREGVLVGAVEETSRREQYNAVSITWTPDDTIPDDDWQLRIFLWDNDPLSTTYYDGPFGKKPIFFDDEYSHIPSQVEAEALARAKLADYTGATRSLDVVSVYNPLLEPGDVIEIVFPDGEIEEHVIDAATFQIGPTARMDVSTRLDRPLAVAAYVEGSASGRRIL